MNIYVESISPVLIAGSSVALAICAWKGLDTWKKQAKTERRAQYIDELTKVVYGFINAITAPIQMVKFSVEIGIESYSHVVGLRGSTRGNEDFIQYIENCGKDDGKEILERLEMARQIIPNMLFLLSKGDALGFENYQDCFDAGMNLARAYNQIEAIAVFIGKTSLNWDNEEVQEALSTHRKISSSAIRESLEANHTEVQFFAKNNYQQLLG